VTTQIQAITSHSSGVSSHGMGISVPACMGKANKSEWVRMHQGGGLCVSAPCCCFTAAWLVMWPVCSGCMVVRACAAGTKMHALYASDCWRAIRVTNGGQSGRQGGRGGAGDTCMVQGGQSCIWVCPCMTSVESRFTSGYLTNGR